MVQEEVAKKIVAQHGRGYGASSLYLQYHFDFELLEKIEPEAFSPPPKVYSRLIYFKPKNSRVTIPSEKSFWKLLKLCFKTPRQTLKNNLRTTHYDINKLPSTMHNLRAQQLLFEDFLQIWDKIL